MKELIEVIAKSLVDHPSEVVVTETVSGDDLLLELKVDPSDMGKVIGRQGRIAKAIRTVVKAASSKSDRKVVVEILQQVKDRKRNRQLLPVPFFTRATRQSPCLHGTLATAAIT